MKNIRYIALIEWFILLLILIGIYGGLQLMQLRAEEPRRAIIAMEMIAGKNYLTPKIFNYNYYNKPPLFNWLLVLVFKISGSFNEIWVRLPSVLSLFLTAFLVFKTVVKTAGRNTAFIAAMLLLVSADILFYGSVDAGEIDLFLMLLVYMQAIAIYYFGARQMWWAAFILSYLCMAAGILTKGLPVIVLQALLLPCWFIYTGQFKKLFTIQHIAGIIVGFAPSYVYFALYNRQSNVWIYLSQLITESSEKSMLENTWGSVVLNILQSPLQVFYICLPATGLLLYCINKKLRSVLRKERLFMFCFVFTLIICVTFFISSETHNRYLYPAFPFIAIMAAIAYSNAAAFIARRWLISYKAVLGLFAVFALVRIGYDVWGIPYQQKNLTTNYVNLSSQILQHTNGTPVFFTGYPQKIQNRQLPFVNMQATVIDAPPVLPYQLPYYIGKTTGTMMRYDSIPVKGQFYLTPVSFLQGKQATVYFTFFDDWVKRDVALVKF